MKRCQRCDFQSDAMLDYCWQCGSKLVEVGQFYPGVQPTQNYSLPNQTPPFNNYQQNYGQNHGQNFGQSYGQQHAPNYRSTSTPISFGRVAMVLAAIFTFLLAVSGAGALVIYRVANRPPAPRYREEYRRPEPVKPAPVKEKPVTRDPKSTQPDAKFEKLWVDYNVRENNRLGMRIHVRFSVYNLKGVDTFLAVYFEKADGTKLTSKDKKFASKNGQVAAFQALKPGFDDTYYEDLVVFMPYDELELSKGKYDLKMEADVIYKDGIVIEQLGSNNFKYEKS